MDDSALSKQEQTLKEVRQHYEMWTQDNEIRLTRKGGWNDITDSYYGKLPDDWPYITKIVDPRIRTSLIEKNARLINNKLRGRLIPREGNDVLGARLNNALLDFQWDDADHGGSMLTKISISDMDTRLYQSKFGIVKWLCIYKEDGTIKWEGNEFTPLDLRYCGMDSAAQHIKNAKWFQYSTWEKIEDLERQTDVSGKPMFNYLGTLKTILRENMNKSSKNTKFPSRVKQLRGIEDRTGQDMAYPEVEVVHELREDRWIDYSPLGKLIMRDINNPYEHGKICVVQLKYYPLQDDALGESEVEPVIPIWKAIQATVCGYMDEVILKQRPPLKIVEGQVRIETIQYGPEAQWIVTRPDSVTEMQSNGEAVRYFETTYSALISAFNVAMGDMSQGTSTVTPFESDKTATEVKASLRQQNVRDQKNQNDLAEFIKDIMLMWLSNNRQFLFKDPKKQEYILKIVGAENFAYFKKAGLDEMILEPEVAKTISDIVEMRPDMSEAELNDLIEAGKTPKHPIYDNPNEKNPEKLVYKPKMEVSEQGDSAEVILTPHDLDGLYDYVADVKSMASGASQDLLDARQKALDLLLNNPSVVQLLSAEGFRPNVKELLTSTLEDLGLRDADRYFEKAETQSVPGATTGAIPNMPIAGLPAAPQTNPSVGIPEQMASAGGIQNPQGIPQGIR